jgi:hypothetical protein
VCFIVLFGIGWYLFGSNEKKVDSFELVQSSEFKGLHQLTINLDSIQNIAVLTDKNYIVVDGLVINLKKRTFGEEPELGFYQNYYEEGDKTPFRSFDSLLESQKIKMDSIQAFQVIEKMKSTGISDIAVHKNGITYRWKTSAMYGEEGIVYSPKEILKDSTRFDLLEKIGENFYHFAV